MAVADDPNVFAKEFMSAIGKDFPTMWGQILSLPLEALALGQGIYLEIIAALERIQALPELLPDERARVCTKISEAQEGLLLIGAHIKMVEELRETLRKVMTFEEG
jgi:hypothetical protein